MAIAPVRLDRLLTFEKITNPNGTCSSDFQLKWQNAVTQIENALNSVIDAQNAADAANAAAAAAQTAADNADTAATAAQAAADATIAETSLVNSFVKNFAGASPLEADSAGNVTVKTHDRQYGDTTAYPDVSLASGALATGEVNPAVVRVYYDDATFSDTTPTYQWTVDPADPPVQGNGRHVVGAIEIPAAGTSDGGYVRNPGYTGVIP